jgi:ubiquinone/menaquinone biosynthesis C-methylase UbiE
MTVPTQVFDPEKYKQTTREQWQAAAEPWHRWGPTIGEWLGPATELMLDMAGIAAGDRVLDVAAGAGEQTIRIARRVGPTGHVLATDISPNILAYAEQTSRQAGLTNVETRVMDGENLEPEEAGFDAVISRVGLIYFPDRQKALTGMGRVLRPGGKKAAIVYSTAEKNQFFSIPVSIIRRRAKLPPPLPGQPGPFSLGNPEVLESEFRWAGFHDIRTRLIEAPLRMPSAADCVRFERESFGALHQMMAGLAEAERRAAWEEIEQELRRFEGPDGFAGPCELVIAVGTRPEETEYGI